jgi:hypothetical protein
VPYLCQLLELLFDLFEFVFPYRLIFEKTWPMGGKNHTLGGNVMIGVEKDNVQLQWQGGADVVADGLSEVNRTQPF